MDRIPLRELRNHASRLIRRARAGERMIVTVDGVPAAEIGPVRTAEQAVSLDEPIATGGVLAARLRTAPRPPAPQPAPTVRSSAKVLREPRER